MIIVFNSRRTEECHHLVCLCCLQEHFQECLHTQVQYRDIPARIRINKTPPIHSPGASNVVHRKCNPCSPIPLSCMSRHNNGQAKGTPSSDADYESIDWCPRSPCSGDTSSKHRWWHLGWYFSEVTFLDYYVELYVSSSAVAVYTPSQSAENNNKIFTHDQLESRLHWQNRGSPVWPGPGSIPIYVISSVRTETGTKYAQCPILCR